VHQPDPWPRAGRIAACPWRSIRHRLLGVPSRVLTAEQTDHHVLRRSRYPVFVLSVLANPRQFVNGLQKLVGDNGAGVPLTVQPFSCPMAKPKDNAGNAWPPRCRPN